jgi:hypothetical protein
MLRFPIGECRRCVRCVSGAGHDACHAPAPPISTAPIAEPIAITPSLVARLAGPADDLKHFLLPRVRRAKGERVTLDAVYARYRRWCDSRKATPPSTQAFAKEFKLISRRGDLRKELARRSIASM